MKAELNARVEEYRGIAIGEMVGTVNGLEISNLIFDLSTALQEAENNLATMRVNTEKYRKFYAASEQRKIDDKLKICELEGGNEALQRQLHDTEARLQVAVEALEAYAGDGALWFRNGDEDGVAHHICTDARKALAKIKDLGAIEFNDGLDDTEQSEPVAWINRFENHDGLSYFQSEDTPMCQAGKFKYSVPLYTHPPKHEPLRVNYSYDDDY